MSMAAYATATHWIGGVKHRRGEWLNGWPCCCSGERVRRIMASGAPLTYEVAKVTCKGCLREMRKSEVLSREIAGHNPGHNSPTPPTTDPPSADSSSCAKGDSNPHGVTH